LKVIKYVFDVLTSYNNSSMKSHCGEINHKLAGYMTLASSIIGIYLLWKWMMLFTFILFLWWIS